MYTDSEPLVYDNEFELSSLPGIDVVVEDIEYVNTTIPLLGWSAKLKVPEPLV